MQKPSLASKMRLGYIVFGILMLVEIIEYILGVGMSSGALPFLVVLMVIGAWPIVRYFMHIPQLWRREE